jgi:hypothetical protein
MKSGPEKEGSRWLSFSVTRGLENGSQAFKKELEII